MFSSCVKIFPTQQKLHYLQVIGVFLLVVFFFHGTTPVQALVYYYKDSTGRVHISDSPQTGFEKITPKRKSQIHLTTERLPAPLPELYTVDDSKFGRIIYQNAQKFKLDPALIRAVIKVESDFNPQVKSHAGAQGLMQLMPGTAKELQVSDPFDPKENIRGGSEYLAKMMKMFDQRLDLSLAAYNAGPGRVRRAGNQIPKIRETQNYVKRVKHYYEKFRNNATKGSNSTEKYRQMAIRYFRMGKYNKAIRYFQRIISIDPLNAASYYNIGFIHSREGYYQKAIDMYRRALQIDPYLNTACYNLAITLERRGEFAAAIKVWQDYQSRESDKEKIERADSYIKELEKFLQNNKI